MTSSIGLPYINIAVAESADHLVRSLDVTLCKRCVHFKSVYINVAEPNHTETNTYIVQLANGLVT